MRLLAVLALLLAFPAVVQAQSAREFGVWRAACDVSGYCSARAIDREFVFSVGRHAEQPWWELKFQAAGQIQPDPSKMFVAGVDGERSDFEPTKDIGAYGNDRSFYFVGKSAQTLMDRMTPGATLTVAFTEAVTERVGTSEFSLTGLTAALLWIDEQQRRLGSERVAEAPPYGLAPIESGEALEVPQALLDRHAADPDCSPIEGIESVADALSNGRTLYMLPCISAAYNFSHKVYVGGSDSFEQQFFADYQSEWGWIGTPYVRNAQYDPASDSIFAFYKARGVGDCGSQGHWQWNGIVFQMVEMRARDCENDLDPNGAVPEFDIVYSGEPVVADTP